MARLRVRTILLAIVLTLAHLDASPATAQDTGRIALVIHGGAGSVTPENVPPDRQAEYRVKLEEALRAGYDVLGRGGSSVDAVVAAITIMEDSPLFNAGKGAVYTSAGTNELDASIMEGRDRRAGAVASIKHIKNPITLARAVMENSKHVMMVGEGAEAFAKEQGFEFVPNEYFGTERRRQQYERTREREETGDASPRADDPFRKFGTVGAVALDQEGTLAAGTSTGGTSYKRWGRVGDSPIVGAGTYADNESCGISATGDGEYFIRSVVAHDISAMMRYAGLSIGEAASAVIHGKLKEMGGEGGIVGLDRHGNVAMVFNSDGMFRGHIDHDGNVEIMMFGD
ncbi:MAG: isoaspartyl peptidase/L-asparaginase [Rhodothermales bacterium]